MDKFPENSRVCFIGDSITQANTFVMYIMRYYAKYFADSNVRFFNCGIAGAPSKTLLEAYSYDVRECRPTHAVITVGVNDSGRELLQNGFSKEKYDMLRTRLEEYKRNIYKLCDMLKKDNVKITLCTPPPIDEYTAHTEPTFCGGYALMEAYADVVRSCAQDLKYDLCDVFAHFSREMCDTVLYHEDRVHPNVRGHFCIAQCILENQGEKTDPFSVLPPNWCNLSAEIVRCREIVCAESLLLKSFSLTYEEGAKIMKDKLQCEKMTPFFKKLAAVYLECKPRQADMKAHILAASKSVEG